jgi:hypothetical protein
MSRINEFRVEQFFRQADGKWLYAETTDRMGMSFLNRCLRVQWKVFITASTEGRRTPA